MGYRHITLVERQGQGYFHEYDLLRQEECKLEIIEADAELDPYPIKSESAQCVICFELLELFFQAIRCTLWRNVIESLRQAASCV